MFVLTRRSRVWRIGHHVFAQTSTNTKYQVCEYQDVFIASNKNTRAHAFTVERSSFDCSHFRFKISSAFAFAFAASTVDGEYVRSGELAAYDGCAGGGHERIGRVCWRNVSIMLLSGSTCRILFGLADLCWCRFMAASKVLGEETVQGGSGNQDASGGK